MVVVVVDKVDRARRRSDWNVGPSVGPLVEHGPVEAFGLAIGLGPEGRVRLWRAPMSARAACEAARRRVVPGVVGQDPLDADAMPGEPGGSVAQEAGAGRSTFVIERRRRRRPGSCRRSPGGCSRSRPAPSGCRSPAAEAVTTAVGDPAELLDVDVEELAGPFADIADRDARTVGRGRAAGTGRGGAGRRRSSSAGMPTTGARRCGPKPSSWRAAGSRATGRRPGPAASDAAGSSGPRDRPGLGLVAAHPLVAVWRLTPAISAAWAIGQPVDLDPSTRSCLPSGQGSHLSTTSS